MRVRYQKEELEVKQLKCGEHLLSSKASLW